MVLYFRLDNAAILPEIAISGPEIDISVPEI
jgi:hypothetical protein